MVKLGAKFSYNGKEWKIVGITGKEVSFSNGKISSSLQLSMFVSFMEDGWIKMLG